MNTHYDALETRDPEARERDIFGRLPMQVAHAKARAPAFARSLAGVDPRAVTSREELAKLPVIRKGELLDLQQGTRPFGGLAASGYGEIARVFASPGPIYEPEGRAPDWWRLARALFAAGFRRGDLVHNCFSYHFTPAGSMLETGAHALGCAVFPGGTGQTEQQVQAIADLGPAGYVGTPSFLRIILEKADEQGVELPSLTKALVSGEAFLKTPEGEGFVQVGEPMFLTDGTDGGVGIAIRKNEEELKTQVNEALAAIMADGTYDALAAKYFDFDVTPQAVSN